MDKQEFLKQLEDALNENGVSAKKVAKYLKKFESLIDEAPEEEKAATIEKLGTPAEIAIRIKNMNNKREETKKISTSDSKKTKPIETSQNVISDSDDDEEREIIMSEKGKRIFLIGAIATAPVNLAICLALAVIFLAMYTAVLLFSGALIIVEIAGVICGVLLGVGGLLYGVVGILPGEIPTFVGQYEIGFGIMLIGIVTVAGILVYEYVMKVTPLACKGITKLIKFTSRKIIQFVKFLKRECGKL